MAEQKNLRVIFTDKADLILVEILKKYGLHENQEVVFNKLKKDKLPNEIKMQRMVEYFGKNIITQKEFNEALAKVFNINSSLAKSLSNDLVINLVPNSRPPYATPPYTVDPRVVVIHLYFLISYDNLYSK